MAKIEDEDFLLGGRGLSVEFCIFCFALRVSRLTTCTYFPVDNNYIRSITQALKKNYDHFFLAACKQIVQKGFTR